MIDLNGQVGPIGKAYWLYLYELHLTKNAPIEVGWKIVFILSML